jgi:hypothetical protein
LQKKARKPKKVGKSVSKPEKQVKYAIWRKWISPVQEPSYREMLYFATPESVTSVFS